MTREEWLNYYHEKTGCNDLQLADDEIVFFHHKHGFITFFTHDDILDFITCAVTVRLGRNY